MRVLRHFTQDRRGVTAIETAMVAPVFFALVFSIFEIGNTYFKQAVIEQAVHDAARQIKVGAAAPSDYANESAEEDECSTGLECFYDELCARVEMFGSCSERLSVDVRQFDSFADLVANGGDTATCTDADGYAFEDQSYDPGERNSVIQVRVCYLIDVINPAIGLNLAATEDGRRAVIVTTLHRNEPYLERGGANPNENL